MRRWYRIRTGDYLLKIARDAYYFDEENDECRDYAERICAEPLNAQVLEPNSTFRGIPMVSFYPRWSGSDVVTTRAAPGRAYALIWIPFAEERIPF